MLFSHKLAIPLIGGVAGISATVYSTTSSTDYLSDEQHAQRMGNCRDVLGEVNKPQVKLGGHLIACITEQESPKESVVKFKWFDSWGDSQPKVVKGMTITDSGNLRIVLEGAENVGSRLWQFES
ncbi:hypothetical protein OVS_04310 [Mycoplasma ovis str. Michigan]|uniref:Uncharacterized protein n=1 Tax=Mycoplasma ovis str. Michigan TaxID=1415773 RepID=A0ABM5P2A0_9MOLU|nr:hypothetical protein [Mycoplasma ovis]AHC40589.1 hypothetical protein OVS_04310 [Mycoplasma ovis str. Michigan]